MNKRKSEDQSTMDGIGPLPDGPEDLMDGPGSASPSTTSGDGVSTAFAGELAAAPFALWNMVQPAALPLDKDEKRQLGEPLAEVLDKHGWGAKLSMAEIRLGFYFFMISYGRAKAVIDAKKLEKAQAEMLARNAEEDKGAPGS